eukprot:jgi/Tetstr1/462957/TSEL_007905.t1
MAEIQITHQDNAWMDRAIFLKWVKDIFLPWTVDKRSTETPMILIMDNLGAHINPEVLQLFVDNHVIIVPLPPHASHFLQPLDVIMQVLKHFKDKATKAFRRLHKKRLIKEKELIIMLFKFLLVDSSGLQRGSAWTMHWSPPRPYQDMLLTMDDLPCRDDINETVSAAADVVKRVDQYLAEAEDSLARAKETRALDIANTAQGQHV